MSLSNIACKSLSAEPCTGCGWPAPEGKSICEACTPEPWERDEYAESLERIYFAEDYEFVDRFGVKWVQPTLLGA